MSTSRKVGLLVNTAAVVLALLLCNLFAQAPPGAAQNAWKSVDDAMGRQGMAQSDGSYKFSMPRKDMKITVAGTPIQAALALGSWVAFLGTPDHAMVMGDLVLSEDEVEPVMMKLQQMGIQQTAVHNHLLHERPRVMYMHIEGHGSAVQMAKAIHDALQLTKTPVGVGAAASAEARKIGIDTAQISSILGQKGKINAGIYQVSVPRTEQITEEGMALPPSMGTATALNFQPTGSGRAAVTGDFVLTADEVNPVIKILREHGIQVTALHSHMLKEQPRLFYMHFWANADAAKLARGLRAALDQTKSVREQPAK